MKRPKNGISDNNCYFCGEDVYRTHPTCAFVRKRVVLASETVNFSQTMKEEYRPYVEALIELAIKEDIGDGDHTSLACIPDSAHGRMKLLCKQQGILAGVEVAEMVLRRLDPEMKFEQVLFDGAAIKPGDVAFYVEAARVRFCRPSVYFSTLCSA